MNENGLRLGKSSLVFVFLFSTLLLSCMLFGVVQTSGAEVDYWAAANEVYDEASEFFDETYIHEIRLYFDDPNWYDTLFEGHDNDRNTADPYFPARFVSHGIEIDPVGARFKGLSTFGFGGFFRGGGSSVYDDIKKPFRIDFNLYDEGDGEETTFFGLKKLNLNNCKLDPSQIREKLFMDFASKYVPTPRSVFTRVYVNDEYFGLYLAMEHIDNTYVESRFGDDEDGNLYKAERKGSLEYLGSDPELYNGFYELKNNEELNDWSGLIELTDVLTNTLTSEIPEELEPIFDVESGVYTLALLDLFVSLDSYIGNSRNYYLYDRSDTGQFTHLLWDANLAFGGFGMGMGSTTDPTEYQIFPSSTASGFGSGSDSTLMLVTKFLSVEPYTTAYYRALAQMLREGFDVDSVAARSQELADLIRDAVINDPNIETTLEDFEAELQETIDFVADRAAYVDAELDAFAKKTDLQLNDLMTVNEGIIADNQGDYDPWVEIYNLGPGLVSSSSLFLTDDSGVPNKWQLPTQNLDDGMFLLLWLDGETGEGTYHVSFGLNPDGGELYLYMQSGSSYVLVDSISYPALDADVSFGRFPDGDGSWHILDDVVTPAEPNQYDEIPDELVINEFMANNDEAVEGPDGDFPDWIELYNGDTEAVDLSGMYLTDDLSDPDDWVFPSGTVIEAGDFLVVWADNLPERGLLHAGFGLNASGDAVYLFASDGVTLVDSVVFGVQLDDVSYGRLPDGDSNWTFLTPTCGLSNSLGTIVDPEFGLVGEVPDGLVINEFMANNDEAVEGPDGDFPDWIELYNGGTAAVDLGGMFLTDDLSDPDDWVFPSGTVIEAGGFLVVWADNSSDSGEGLHASFCLNASGEAVGLFAADGVTQIDSIIFDKQLDDVSYGRLPDGDSNWTFLTPTVGLTNELATSATFGNPAQAVDVPDELVINEFMANNDVAVEGPDGDFPDWIELYNGGTEAVDLGGMFLTDDLSDPDDWVFPSGTIIEAGGFLVVWADNLPERGLLHAGFGLNASGEAVYLFASDGVTLVDSVVFGVQLDDVSYGRLPDGGSNWTFLTPTCGLSNSLGDVVVPGDVPVGEVPEGLVINEFMADNEITIAGPEGTFPDWIELYNGGNETVDLGGMFLTDNLNDSIAWQFSEGTILRPGEFLVVWADNSPDSGDGVHVNFALAANGEEIGLFAADGITLIDSIVFPKQLGDISYGRMPDGAETWEYLLAATPGWGNNQRSPTSGSSLLLILLLVGLVGVVSILFVVITKYSERRG